MVNLQSLSNLLLAPEYLHWLWNGFLVTLALSALTVIASSVWGFVLAALRDNKILRWPVVVYCSVFRNTPLLVQFFFWYFGAAQLLPRVFMQWLNMPHELTLMGLSLEWPSFEFLTGFVGLTLYSAAFVSEEIRSGIRGVTAGQKQAGSALGLTHWQVMRFVILPQALRIALPSLLGQYMNVIKNSSLAMAFGVAELSYASRQVETETLKAFQAFGVATVLYIAAVAVVEVWGLWYQHQRSGHKHFGFHYYSR